MFAYLDVSQSCISSSIDLHSLLSLTYHFNARYCRLSSEEYHSIVINSARASVASATPLEMAAVSALVMDCFLVSKQLGMADGGLYAFKYDKN